MESNTHTQIIDSLFDDSILKQTKRQQAQALAHVSRRPRLRRPWAPIVSRPIVTPSPIKWEQVEEHRLLECCCSSTASFQVFFSL